MATNERTEEQAIIDTEALKLRSRGFTYQQIADNMGCTKSNAYARVKRALGDIPREVAEEYRALESERLDALLAVATHQALTGKRSLFAIDRCLMIMDRRAKLLGLDAPARVHAMVEMIPLDQQKTDILGLLDQLAAREKAISESLKPRELVEG